MQTLNQSEARIVETLALGDLLAVYGGPQLALQVLKRDQGAFELLRAVAERAKSGAAQNSADALLGFDAARDARGYSICRLIRAQAEGRWSDAGLERDLSNLATTKTGAAPNGWYIPLGVALRDFNIGTASEAGNLVGAVIDGGRAVDPLRKASVLAGMGATILTGLRSTLEIPRFESTTAAAWKSEIGAAVAVTESTARVDLVPKRSAVTMELSRQALVQATPALDKAIMQHLTGCLLELLEYGALNGDGTNDAPVGIRSTSGIGAVVGGTDGAQLDFTHLADLEKAADLGNFPATENAGFVVNTATKRWLRTKAAGTNLPYIWTGGERPLLGYRAGVTGNLPANLSKGASGAVCSTLIYSADWSQLILGIYGGGIDLTVDRVTKAAEGKVKITAALHAGVGALVPAAFAKMDDAKTA